MKMKWNVDLYSSAIKLILSISLVVLLIVALALSLAHDKKIEAKRSKAALESERIVSLSRDSLVAFMSVIIEANQTLVNDPKSCRWLVLAEVKQPCYAMRHGEQLSEVKLEKPSNSRVYIWIPTDSATWSKSSSGYDLTKSHPLYIGSTPYTGDLTRVRLTAVDKRDRGF